MKDNNIPAMIVRDVPRDLIMGLYDAVVAGSFRAYMRTQYDKAGLKPTMLGNMRNWCINESFYDVLLAHGCMPNPLKGNSIIVGRSGIFTLGRINDNNSSWHNLARSKLRRELAAQNQFIESLVQPSLFGNPESIPVATAFVLARFSGSLTHQPEAPVSIDLVIPSPDMKRWVFCMPLLQLLNLYESAPVQEDNAFGTLRLKGVKNGGEDDSK